MKEITKHRRRIIGVYPQFSPSFWSFEVSVKYFLGLGATMPPLGLLTVLAMIPEDSFELVPIADLRFQTLRDEDILSADIIMISAMIAQKEYTRDLIQRVKRLGRIVVIGGPYPTLAQEEVLAMGADYLICGEAEITLSPFLEDFIAGKAVSIYTEESVCDRKKITTGLNGKPRINEGHVIPRWDLADVHMYSSLALQFSRGCPFDCEFCNITSLFGRTPRTKSPHQVILELEAILATGWRGSIFIVDDNFIGDKVRVRSLLRELIGWQERRRYPFNFFTEASLNLANPDLSDILEMMVQAGFEEVFVGIETTDPEALAIMRKVQNSGELSEKVKIIQSAGLEITAGFIIGLDGDKPGSANALASFIQATGIVMPMPGLLTVLPGTRLHDRLESEGRLRHETSGNNTHHFEFNFKTRLPEDELIASYARLLEKLFSPKEYYDRCRTLRSRLGKRKKCQNHMNLMGFVAAWRIFVYFLFRKPCLEFVKFMVETMLKAPREFPQAVTQAVKYAHFAELTETALKEFRTTKTTVL